MRTLYYLLLEYLLILKLAFQSLYKTPPAAWKVGHKGDVVLVPGFSETWVCLEYLANHLNNLGYKIHVVPDLNYSFASISVSAEILWSYIERHRLKKVYLLAHSKGGVVAKTYLDADTKDPVKKLFSFSTPFQGTLFGKVNFLSLHELNQKSGVIKKILSNSNNLHKIINIYPLIDNHVFPNRNGILPNATNEQVPVIGHTRILFDSRSLEVIEKYL